MNIKRRLSLIFSMIIILPLFYGCSSKQTDILSNNNKIYSLDNTEAIASCYDEADKRKDAILCTATEIIKSDQFIRGKTYNGTAYYISPDGNDDNDGLTPETAWKSAHHVMWGDVKTGDAVFFERGGVYRIPMTLRIISDVTYSAYGEGAKPVLTCAAENSAREDCWELFYDGDNGEKIWHYYKAVGEVSGIIFDDEVYARRILEWPTKQGWLALNIIDMDPANGKTNPADPCSIYQVTGTNEYRTIEQQLTDDMTYICRVDVGDCDYPLDFSSNYYEGDLYLRNDAGNPGLCYEDIEIVAVRQDENGEVFDSIFTSPEENGWVLDNLSLKYYGRNAVFSFLTTSNEAVIQNCTVEWGGTRLHMLYSGEPTVECFLIGDCLYDLADNVTIRNNYFREGGNSSTFETDGQYAGNTTNLGSYLFEGNLVENCGQGIRTYFIDRQYNFEELIIRDNMIINTGNSINNACFEEPAAIDIGVDPVDFADKLEIYGNTLIGSTAAMMRIPYHETVEIDIHDNLIFQNESGVLITEGYNSDGKITWHKMTGNINNN